MTPLERLRAATGEVDETVLEDYLEQAKSAIMARRYPFQEWPDELEKRYLDLQYRCALALYNKRGGEYEISHSENGVSRGFGSEGIPIELLREVIPLCEVM